MNNSGTEVMVEKQVTYVLEIEGQVYIIENVPARVDLETGERYYSPDTVERIQKIIWERKKPARFVEAPVYDYIA